MKPFDGIYLDHNATTPVKPRVRELMLQILAFPGNASAIHKAGREARRLIEDSRQALATALNAGPRDVLVFTSGATEANNMILQKAAVERILVAAIEHPSVLSALALPANAGLLPLPHAGEGRGEGTEVIPVLPSGLIDLLALEKMLQGNTKQTLISVMSVNNETGVIQPVEAVVALARKYGCLVHTDAAQAFGRMPLDLQKLGADFVTLSAHKMGGPQGTGCLVICNCVALPPLLFGGNQEKSLRAGTENLAGICGFAEAAKLIDIDGYKKLGALRDKIEKELSSMAPGLKIYGKDTVRVPNTTMFSLPGVPSETQLIALDLAGICVSNGSACSSGTVKSSHVLKAMGASEAEAGSSLRVSLGWNTTEKDVDAFIAKWRGMYDRVKGKLHAT